ncbi:MAG TPA: S9 family peptidase [Bryobacteraceae bacterium]|nr:S9 family peptidase [Bryobacteraceae bacterium]
MKLLKITALALLGCAIALAANHFDIPHVAKMVRVADPQISPDGKSIVIVVSRPNYEDDRFDAELVLVDIASKKERVLTHDRRGVSSPRWSPSGDRLAFLAMAANNKLQVFSLPMNGGDPLQVTKSPTGVQQFAWRPDGEMIAFAASDEAQKKTGEERHNDVFEVGNNDFLVTSAPLPTHLWVVASTGGEARRLTSGNWSMPISHPPGSPASPIAWSPDGKSIAFVKVATPFSGDADHSAIQMLDVDTGNFRALTGRTLHEGYPAFSPDGKTLAYWYPRNNETKFGNDIHIVAASGGDGKNITYDIDRNMARAIWMPDGKSLLVGANDGTTTSLWVQPLNGKARQLQLGKICTASAFWVDMSVGPNGQVALSASEPQRPAELYYLASAESAVQRLTDFNHEVAALDLGKTETIEWNGPDGYHEDGVVTYPPDFNASQKYPLVLYVHGGPRSASKEAFSSRAQLLAAQGWVVFEPNYRGSDNLGNTYQSAIQRDSGDGPGRDVMAGVEYLKKRGWVDDSRMAVSGWSYGGYMTTWLLGHYNVWKAAVAGAAVTDWLDQYNLGDANVRRGTAFGGSPYAGNMAIYVDQSPITYANKIKAPTLILSDTGDYRVTPTQSYKLYHALKDNGVTTRFFAYPVGGHSPTDPVRQRDIDRRWIAWLADYLNDGKSPRGTEGDR